MKPVAAKGKITQLDRSRWSHRAHRTCASRPAHATGPTSSYLKTRIRASRLYEAAFILAIIELTRRLHQAYQQAYDKQASDWVLPQNSAPTEHPPVDKGYGWWGPCNRSASDLMATVRRDFSKFGNYGELAAEGNAVGFIKFNPGPISQGRVIGITVGAVSTAAPSDIYYSRNVSVTVSSATSMSFTFTTNPGHFFYPGTISFSARDTNSGIRFGIDLKGYFGDLESQAGFGTVGAGFEDRAWRSFLEKVRSSCGNSPR